MFENKDVNSQQEEKGEEQQQTNLFMETVTAPKENNDKEEASTTKDAGEWERAVVYRDQKPSVAATQETAAPEQQQRRRNIVVAIASVLIAVLNYAWQLTHPITPIMLLSEMEQQSVPVTEIGRNGKPTVVDFWAPWCENCKLAAPTLQKVEQSYKDKVNFVMINGDQAKAWPYIEKFGVDAIPHLALVSAEGDVETALIGPIPKSVLEADLNVLIENEHKKQKEPLPYVMLDVFANRPEERRVRFDP